MKQKDKKQTKRDNNKLSNIVVEDLDYYDDIQVSATSKGKRTSEKHGVSYKNDMDLKTGQVVEIKSNYMAIVRIEEQDYVCTVGGRLKQFKFETHMLLAVGDRVEVDFIPEHGFRIEQILPRRNTLSRFSDAAFQKEIIVAANIDILVITVSWLRPMLKPGLIDRYLCLAVLHKITPVICLNKMDLCLDLDKAQAQMKYYESLGLHVIYASTLTSLGMLNLKQLLTGKDTVFSGQSGTGKSSLINWLEPELNLKVDEVSDYNDKGKHSTTQSKLVKWSFGGNLIDTPGLKTVNLHHNQKAEIPLVFPGFSDYAPKCYYRSCQHTHEADCAVLQAVEMGEIPASRYDSYLRIMESL